MNTSKELEQDIQKGLDMMRTLRDEVRLKVHLAEMDAKDEWNKLEPHLLDLEQSAKDLTEATKNAVTNAVQRLSKLKSSLS